MPKKALKLVDLDVTVSASEIAEVLEISGLGDAVGDLLAERRGDTRKEEGKM
jgi:hypothetical protein